MNVMPVHRSSCPKIWVPCLMGLMLHTLLATSALASNPKDIHSMDIHPMDIHIIPLQHQAPDALVHNLKPMLPQGGMITTHENKLIIRTTTANILELKTLIEELDTPLEALIISVKRGNETLNRHSQFTVGGKLYDSGNTQIRSGNHTQQRQVIVRHQTLNQGNNGEYQVRGLSGRSSYINVGQEVAPLYSAQVGRGTDNIGYQSVEKGFYVTPTLRDERVTVAVEVNEDSLDGANIQRDNITTTVTGKIGEWISLGGLGRYEQNNESGIGRQYRTREQRQQTVYIKIDRVP